MSEWRVHTAPGSLPAIVSDEQVIAERVYNGHGPLLASAPKLLAENGRLRTALEAIHERVRMGSGAGLAGDITIAEDVFILAHMALVEDVLAVAQAALTPEPAKPPAEKEVWE